MTDTAVNPNLGTGQTKPPAFERRRARRYWYSAPISIRTARAGDLQAVSIEISEMGTSLMTSAELRVGETIELDPVGGKTAKAIVRRNVGKLYGLEFLCLNPAQVEEIRKICTNLPAYRPNTVDVWTRSTSSP
jgi:hypothetical protein